MKKRNVFIFLMIIIVITFSIATFFLNNKVVMISSNIKKGIEKYWGNKVVIKEVKDFEAYGKKFRLVLSTPVNDEKYKYFNCYEEKFNGFYYKSYQASKSKALVNFSVIFFNTDKENAFTVVYGYNKGMLVDNYELKISKNEKNIISSIKGKEYFIDAYKGFFEGPVSATGKDGSDMLEAIFN